MRRRTERVQADTASPAPVIPGVSAPLVAPADERATRAAVALGTALKVGTQFAETLADRVYRKASLNGTRAALDGREPTPAELKSDAFKLAYESLRTERSLTDFQSKTAADYETVRSQPNFNAGSWFDQQALSVYGGLDPERDVDREVLGYITPKLEEMRAKLVAHDQVRAFEDVKSQAAADSVAIFDNIRSSGRAPTAQEWDDTEAHLFKIGRNDPEYVNQTMLAIVQKAAADGDLKTVMSVPASWGDNNVPSIRTNAKYAAHFENALTAAQSQAYTNEEHARLAADRALKDRRDTFEANTFADMLGGRNPAVPVQNALRSGDLTGERAESLMSAWRAMNATGSEGHADYNLATKLEVGLRTGTATQQDVVDAVPLIGSGSKAQTLVSHLFEVAHTSQDDRLQTPDAKSWRSRVQAASSPTQSPLNLDFDGGLARQQRVAQADALRVYDETVLAGKSPQDAAKAAMDAHKVIAPATAANPAVSNDERRTQLRQLIDSGELTEDQAIALYTGEQ